MNLLLNRDQKSAALFSFIPLRIGAGVMFQLHAELELDDEEQQLIHKYQFVKVPIVNASVFDDLKQAFRPALIVGILTLFIVSWLGGFGAGWTFATLVTLVMTAVYYYHERELILVRHLLDGGRTFRCDSIVELIHKEAYLEYISEYLRQVLESAKNWHDREVLPIKPLDKKEAKQAVLKRLHF